MNNNIVAGPFRPAAVASPAIATSRPAKGISTEGFTQTIELVRVTARIVEQCAVDPRLNPEAAFADYQMELWSSVGYHKERGTLAAGCRSFVTDGETWANMAGRRQREITFKVRLDNWESFLADCETLKVQPLAMIRAALVKACRPRETGPGRVLRLS